MLKQSDRPSDEEIELVIDTYSDMLFKICLVILCNASDAEDAVQETIIKYILKSPQFNDAEHEKAWLITVATNYCRNLRRYNFKRCHIDIDDLQEFCEVKEDCGLLDSLMQLPAKYKTVLTLYYIEDYKVNEIADMLGLTPSAVKKRLQNGRNMLKKSLGEGEELYGF